MMWSSTSLCIFGGMLLGLQLRHEVQTSFRVVTSNAMLVLKLNAIAYFEEKTEFREEFFLNQDARISEGQARIDKSHAEINRKRAYYYEKQEELGEEQLEEEEEKSREDESLRTQIVKNLTEHTKTEQDLERSESHAVCRMLPGVCDFFGGSSELSQERLEIVNLSSELNTTTKEEYLDNLTSSMLEHEIDEYNETATELLDLARVWEQASAWDLRRAQIDQATAQELARLIATERLAIKQLTTSLWTTIEMELHTATQKLLVVIFLGIVGVAYYGRRMCLRVSNLHPEERSALWQDFWQYLVIAGNALTGLSLLNPELFMNFVSDFVEAPQRVVAWIWLSLYGAALLAVVRPADTIRIRLFHFGFGCCLFTVFNGILFLVFSVLDQGMVVGILSHPLTRVVGLIVLFVQAYVFKDFYDGSTLPTTIQDDETLTSEMSPLRSDAMSEVSPLPSEPYYSGKSATRISFRSVTSTTLLSQLVLYGWCLMVMISGKLLLESWMSFRFYPVYTALLYFGTIAGCVYFHFQYPFGSVPVRSVHV